MESTHVEKVWPKIREIIKDEKVKANVKSGRVESRSFNCFNIFKWLQDCCGLFSK